MPISRRIRQQLERASWIRRMFEEGERLRRRYGPDAVVDLSLGNPEVEPPAAFHRALERTVAELPRGAHRYMHNAGLPEVRDAVARRLADDTGLPFTGRDVLLCTGAASGLNVLLRSVLEPGDEVIVLAPYFPEYPFYVENHGGLLRVVETRRDFSIDPERLAAAIGPRTRVLLLNSPNNPTGRVIPRQELQVAADLLRERAPGALLVSDEPYRRLVYGGAPCPGIEDLHPRAVLVGSHSKDLAIPGERIGWVALSPRMDERERAELIHAMTFCMRTLGFVNAPALMQRVVRHVQSACVPAAFYERRARLLVGALREMGYEVLPPEGGFYAFPRAPIDDDVAFVRELAAERVLVVPGAGFGRPGHFRVSFCVPSERIERALPAFERAAQRHGLRARRGVSSAPAGER